MNALLEKGFTFDVMKSKGFLVVIRRLEIDYKYPLFMNEEISIKTFVSEFRNTSGTFTQQIFVNENNRLAADAKVTWVFTNLKGQPIPIPDEIRSAFDIR